MSNPQQQIRMLIVSVGSLVGQNILDSLDYAAFNRRHLVHVSGTNSIAESANNFRCDACFLAPRTDSREYAERMREILIEVQPHVVLCARDADTAAMHDLMSADRSLPGRLPYGTIESVLSALNKWQSFRFSERHNLPFAASFLVEDPADPEGLRRFIEEVGYPLVVKPVEGFASKGVFFVRDWEEAQTMAQRSGSLFQEYLGTADELTDYFSLLRGPAHLFTEAPHVRHHTCHVPIARDGRIGDVFVLQNHHNFGAVMRMRRVAHPELEAIARSFAEAFVAEGGWGPLSVQFRADRNGKQKAQEMNLRTTGSTFARLMMGQDEIGSIIRDLVPEKEFPLYVRSTPGYGMMAMKSLTTFSIEDDQITELETTGSWRS
jgi:carbamoyl-phosphate synthase large subunit